MDNVTGALAAFLLAAGPLAVGVTKGVDLLRNLFDQQDRAPSWVWNVAAFGVGVALCVGWRFNPVAGLIDAIPATEGTSTLTGVAGQVLSGLILGGMAGFWHEPLSGWGAKAVPGETPSTTTRIVRET